MSGDDPVASLLADSAGRSGSDNDAGTSSGNGTGPPDTAGVGLPDDHVRALAASAG